MRRVAFFLIVSSLIGIAEARAQGGVACPAIVATRPTVAPPQRFKAGEVVPPYSLDQPLQWIECPALELAATADRTSKKRSFLYVTVDEKGVVVDVKPRGLDPEGFYDTAVAAVKRWRTNAPKWKNLPVRSAFAADIVYDPSAAAAQPATPAPAPAPAPAQNQPAAVSATEPPAPATAAPVTPIKNPASAPDMKPAETKETPTAPLQQASTPPAPAPATPASSAAPQSVPTKPAAVEQKPPAATEQTPPPIPALVNAQQAASAPPTQSTPASTPVATPPASQPAPTQPAPATPEPTPAAAQPARAEKPIEPERPCPRFFVLPATEQPPVYRAGDLVPNAYLDAKPAWVQCPSPDFSGVAARTVSLIVVVDDKGAVREVRPRGQSASAQIFQRAKVAVTGWRVAPAPRYRSLPVWTSTALDLRNELTNPTPAAPVPSPAAAAPAPAANASPSGAAGSAQAGDETPFVVDYYYKVKWGYADEFWKLFLKNHWPVLRKQMESGRILDVRASKPVYHATEDGRWDFRVTIVFRNTAAAFANVDTAALERQLFPDQETFHREEQRRFEILLAHWDAPVQPVKLEK